MIRGWTSATVSDVGITVCRGDLVTPRISGIVGEDEKVEARPVHVRYEPHEGGGSAPAHNVGGETDPNNDPVYYELDLAPFWCPFPGAVRLAGGGGQAQYTVRFERVRCVPESRAGEHTMTLRDVDAAVALPRGTWAVQALAESDATFRFAGEQAHLALPAGLVVPLGGLSLGTVEATSLSIRMLICHLRIG
ncbi:hypothetical protein [Sorangium sp. So ce131]|uniref:hypothetical protein n=1 Tax=Sorangium sp. So ce131 TaxID=3133282 RepID=UPI003F647FD9